MPYKQSRYPADRPAQTDTDSDWARTALVSSLPGMLFEVDSTGQVLDWVIPTQLYSGVIALENLAGRPLGNIFSRGMAQKILAECRAAREAQEPRQFNLNWQTVEDNRSFEARVEALDSQRFLIVLKDTTGRQRLENQWRRYEFIVNAAKELLALIDRKTRYQAVNDAYCSAHNLMGNQIIGKTVAEIWGLEIFEEVIQPMLEKALSGAEAHFEGWFRFSALGRRYFEVSYYPYTREGDVTHVVVVSKDATARKISEERFHDYHKRLSILSEISSTFLATQSPQEVAQETLNQFRQLVPYSQAGIWMINPETGEAFIAAQNNKRPVGDNPSAVIPELATPEEAGLKNASLVNAPFSEQQGFEALEQLMLKSGIQSSFSVPLIVEERLVGVMILGSDSKDSFRSSHIALAREVASQLSLVFSNALLFDKVRASQTQLRRLTSRLVSAQEDERKRISLELHDQAGQSLTAIKLQMAVLKTEMAPDQTDIQAKLDSINALLDDTSDLIRDLARDLRPPALEKVGIHRTIRAHCVKNFWSAALKIRYSGQELPGLDMAVQLCLYRVFQEAMTNIVKHAEARRVWVTLLLRGTGIELTVRDDGKGFHNQPPYTNVSGESLGLVGMRERLAATGGNLTIQTGPNDGTTVTARVPGEAAQ
jgi:PAS domain S-box-containing protein